jgi:hypothetical protein
MESPSRRAIWLWNARDQKGRSSSSLSSASGKSSKASSFLGAAAAAPTLGAEIDSSEPAPAPDGESVHDR